MIFTDPFFIVFFLPISVSAFYIFGRMFGREAALATVFAASLLFYLNWGIASFSVMLTGTIVNFVVCSWLLRLDQSQKLLRRSLFSLGQIYNFGTLILFKYALPLITPQGGAEVAAAAIPVGISFYTFQQAVLLADAYARNPDVVSYFGVGRSPTTGRAFIRFGAFHCFFPQLVVGPITYLSEFGPQVLSPYFAKPRRADFEIGLTLIAIGLFKKVAIADGLGIIVDPTFGALQNGLLPSQAQAWAATLAYFAQLYFDFSGYSDMALGIGRLFGVRLPINFDSPLRASGIADFYRRWHITLTRVIGRFLFTPISIAATRWATHRRLNPTGVRVVGQWFPLLVNFEVIALWHGTTPTFLLFGLIHGAWFILESEVKRQRVWRRYKDAVSETVRRTAGQLLTFLPLMMTFALFRSNSMDTFLLLVRCLWTDAGPGLNNLKDLGDAYLLIAFAFAIVWLAPNTTALLRGRKAGLETWQNPTTTIGPLARLRWRASVPWAIGVSSLVVASLFFLGRKAPFIYMGY